MNIRVFVYLPSGMECVPLRGSNSRLPSPPAQLEWQLSE
jgi:hypothetical protein